MEHEEVVSLAHELRGNRTRLLGDEDAPESVLATLFRPFHKNCLPFLAVRREDGLRLFDDCHDVQELSLGSCREVRLIPLEDLVQDQGCNPTTVNGCHEGNVDDDDVVAFEMPENPIEHSRSLVMEPLDDGHDVVDDRWGRRFGDVLDYLSNLGGIGAVPIALQ